MAAQPVAGGLLQLEEPSCTFRATTKALNRFEKSNERQNSFLKFLFPLLRPRIAPCCL